MLRRFAIVIFIGILCPLILYGIGYVVYITEFVKEKGESQPKPGTISYYFYTTLFCGLIGIILLGITGLILYGLYILIMCIKSYIIEGRWYF